jgi:hypothetical protein
MPEVELADIWRGQRTGNSSNIDRKIQYRVRSTPERGLREVRGDKLPVAVCHMIQFDYFLVAFGLRDRRSNMRVVGSLEGWKG